MKKDNEERLTPKEEQRVSAAIRISEEQERALQRSMSTNSDLVGQQLEVTADMVRAKSIEDTKEAMAGVNENSSRLDANEMKWPERLLSEKADKALHGYKAEGQYVTVFKEEDGSLYLPPSMEVLTKARQESAKKGGGTLYDNEYDSKMRSFPIQYVATAHGIGAACLDSNQGKVIGLLAEMVNELANHGLIIGHLTSLVRITLMRPGGSLYLTYPLFVPGVNERLTGEKGAADSVEWKTFKMIVGKFHAIDGNLPNRPFPDEKATCAFCKEEKLVTNFEWSLGNIGYAMYENPLPTDTMVCKDCIAAEFKPGGWQTPIDLDGVRVGILLFDGVYSPATWDELRHEFRVALLDGNVDGFCKKHNARFRLVRKAAK